MLDPDVVALCVQQEAQKYVDTVYLQTLDQISLFFISAMGAITLILLIHFGFKR